VAAVLARTDGARARGERAESLARWHRLLVERLVDTEGDALLDRLVSHPALGGPELTSVRARLTRERGETEHARRSRG